jgi:hypothetical protein
MMGGITTAGVGISQRKNHEALFESAGSVQQNALMTLIPVPSGGDNHMLNLMGTLT